MVPMRRPARPALADGRAAREARLATALRENLKRRKAASGAAERPDALAEGAINGPSGDGSGAGDDANGRGIDGAATGAAGKV